MFKNKSKKTRSNLAGLMAIAIVTMLASIPLVGTTLRGGPDSFSAALQMATNALAAASFQVASN